MVIRTRLVELSSLEAVAYRQKLRGLREASLCSGESLRMRFRCEPSLPVDVIGLFVLLPAPVL